VTVPAPLGGGGRGAWLRLLGLLALAAVAVAAEPGAVPDPGPAASPLPLDERLAQAIAGLQRYPRWCGPLLALLGLVPLFHGWRLIRWTMAVCSAAVAGGAVLAFAMPGFDPALAWTAAVSAAIIAGLLGFFLYQALVAMQGALLGFLALSVLAGQLLPQHQGVAIAAGVLGGALGFLLGWRVAPYLGIVESVTYAYAMILAGMLILCRTPPGGEALVLALIVAVVTVVPGLVVQVREHHGRGG
jgi:hypothetical protein